MDYIDKNRDFKGVWIPKEIWLNENLTMLEKVILIEIDSLDNEEHCSAGNDYLAQFCQCSEWKVSVAIKKLQELGYIEVISFDGRHRKLRSCLKKIQRQTLENPKADSGKSKAININNNLDNNNNCYLHNNEPKAPVKKTTSSNSSNNNSPNKSFCKESTDSYIAPPTPEEGRRAKRLTRKDQLVNYVNELEYSSETKDVLFKWIFQIGLPKGVTVQQLSDMLKNIWDSCNDESIVRKSIEESYLNNWFGFYPPKTTAKQVPYKPEISCKRADPKNLSKEVF